VTDIAMENVTDVTDTLAMTHYRRDRHNREIELYSWSIMKDDQV